MKRTKVVNTTEMLHELVNKYYTMIDATSDELIDVLETGKQKQLNDDDLCITTDQYITGLATLRTVITDIQEANMLRPTKRATELLQNLLVEYLILNSDQPDDVIIETKMLIDHIGRDCTLVFTR